MLGSSLVSTSSNKSSLIYRVWNLIAFTLSTRLSQRICNNDLRVKLCIWFCKIFHLFVWEENKVYIRCNTPKKDVPIGQELDISQSTKFRLVQPIILNNLQKKNRIFYLNE